MAIETAIAVGGSLLGGLFGASKARKAAKQRAAATKRAYQQFRSPEEIIAEQYTTGIYGEDPMATILGREAELIPQFQELAGIRARGIRDIQEESKLRQLDLLGQFGADIRSTLEDPRLARLAEMDIAEAERLSAEAAAPLSGERAREAEQTALQMSVRQGRGRGQGAIAQAILGRAGASDVLQQQAAGARQRALVSAGQARVDPFQFLFGLPSIEERQFLEAGIQAQKTASQGQILGNMISGIGSQLAGMNFGGSPQAASLGSMQQMAAPMLQPRTLQYNMPSTSFTGGGFTFGP